MEKALQVLTEDSRQNIISRRVLVPKGGDEGGGGGADAGPGTPVRKDFRVLAFWLGSVVTDAAGRAPTEVTLPESLTTYRIMAVAGDKRVALRLGRARDPHQQARAAARRPSRASWPSATPRASAPWCTASSRTRARPSSPCAASIPPCSRSTGEAKQTVAVSRAAARREVRFDVRARRRWARARVQMTVKLLGETRRLRGGAARSSPVVAGGRGRLRADASRTRARRWSCRRAWCPASAGCTSRPRPRRSSAWAKARATSSSIRTAARSSAPRPTLALALAADLGERLPPARASSRRSCKQTAAGDVQGAARRSSARTAGSRSGRATAGRASPYLTSYVLHVLQRGQALGYAVTPAVLDRAYAYLEAALAGERPTERGLVAGVHRVAGLRGEGAGRGRAARRTATSRACTAVVDRMPVFALAYLLDAMAARGRDAARAAPSCSGGIRNAILPEGGTAHVEELSDPVPALVLELERALDGAWPWAPSCAGRPPTTRSCRGWCAG